MSTMEQFARAHCNWYERGRGNQRWFLARLIAVLVACGITFLVAALGANGRLAARHDQGGSSASVAIIVHILDAQGNPVPTDTVKDIQVSEHGKMLSVTGGPRTMGRKQIVFVLDSNIRQAKVIPLEKDATGLLLAAFEKEGAQGAMLNYGAEIHSSGTLTDDWESLKTFNGAIEAETDKRNDTVFAFAAMKQGMEALGDGPGTKALVLFAEGNDRGSGIGWKSLALLAERNHIACYVVLFADHSFYGTKAIRHYGWDLVELTPKTGGKFWEVGSNRRKAARVVEEVIRQIDSQSVVEIAVPKDGTRKFHELKVTTSGRRVAAQSGYFR